MLSTYVYGPSIPVSPSRRPDLLTRSITGRKNHTDTSTPLATAPKASTTTSTVPASSATTNLDEGTDDDDDDKDEDDDDHALRTTPTDDVYVNFDKHGYER